MTFKLYSVRLIYWMKCVEHNFNVVIFSSWRVKTRSKWILIYYEKMTTLNGEESLFSKLPIHRSYQCYARGGGGGWVGGHWMRWGLLNVLAHPTWRILANCWPRDREVWWKRRGFWMRELGYNCSTILKVPRIPRSSNFPVAIAIKWGMKGIYIWQTIVFFFLNYVLVYKSFFFRSKVSPNFYVICIYGIVLSFLWHLVNQVQQLIFFFNCFCFCINNRYTIEYHMKRQQEGQQ